jgi:hypothetical protein
MMFRHAVIKVGARARRNAFQAPPAKILICPRRAPELHSPDENKK